MTVATAPQPSPDDEKARRFEVLRRWDGAGQGHLPLPESPEAFANLPLHVRMQVEAHDPELARMLAPLRPLPAGTELRLAEGIDAILPEDVDHLVAAGHHEIVAQLRTRYLEGLEATHQANREAEMKAREEWEAGAEARRQASQEEFNLKMRRHYVSTIGKGLPPSPPAAPTIPAILKS